MLRKFVLSVFLMPFVAVAAVDVFLTGAEGQTVGSDDFSLAVTRATDATGAETIRARVVSRVDGTHRLRLVARLSLTGGEDMAYDGRVSFSLPGTHTTGLLADAFPMLAAWKGERGVSLALGAEAFDSFVDAETGSKELKISVRAAFLHKGQVYETVFHAFPFNAKYAERDAYARYYLFYPRRFKRDPNVNPMVYGASANYASWRQADPEPARFMHATAECCIGASRTWGDPLGLEQPTSPRNTDYAWDEELGYTNREGRYIRKKTGEITRQEFAFHRDERLSFGYYCGVANTYYVMALANISKAIADRHPDSVAVGKTFADSSYGYAPMVFTFPECSWGREIRRQLAELAQKADISAIYFDVSRPRETYRGERLADMSNVSWDAYGPTVVRSVGSAKLFEDVRRLREKNGGHALGVNVNTRYLHIYDIFYADASEQECQPWAEQKPFPIDRRLAAGEKAFSLWEGFTPEEFDPNFKSWDMEDKKLLYSALSRFAIHASFRTGALLPASFLSEYTALMSHAFVRMNRAGWKPVPGAVVRGEDWELARYGRGCDSFLAVNNLQTAPRQAKIEIFTGEIDTDRAGCRASDALLFVPFYGGKAETRVRGGRTGVSLTVGPQLATVAEAVGRLSGEGRLSAEWRGDFDAETLTVESADFAGEVMFREEIDTYRLDGPSRRRLTPGEKVVAVYRETEMPGAGKKIRAATSFDVVRHAADGDSREMALRVAHYFKKAVGDAKAPKTVVDKALPARTFLLAGVTVTSPDRWEFSRRTTRLIDLVNRERHPTYSVPMPMRCELGKPAGAENVPTAMPSSDKEYYTHVRL